MSFRHNGKTYASLADFKAAQMAESFRPLAEMNKGAIAKKTGANETERKAVNLFPGNFTFEGRTFQICGGAKYTPDWVDITTATAIEVKGEFIRSRDGRRRFDEVKYLYPGWTWIWCRLRTSGRKGKRWEIEIYGRTT